MSKKIKILGISSSYTKGVTDYALGLSLEAAAEVHEDIVTDVMKLRDYDIKPCNGCNYCLRNPGKCIHEDDTAAMLTKFFDADGYILASPVYSYNPTPSMLLLFNKMRAMREKVPGLFGKPASALAVGGSRAGGQELTINCMINLCLARNIFVVGGSSANFNYTGGKMWTQNRGLKGAREDEVGITSMQDIGRCLGKAAILLEHGRSQGGSSLE